MLHSKEKKVSPKASCLSDLIVEMNRNSVTSQPKMGISALNRGHSSAPITKTEISSPILACSEHSFEDLEHKEFETTTADTSPEMTCEAERKKTPPSVIMRERWLKALRSAGVPDSDITD